MIRIGSSSSTRIVDLCGAASMRLRRVSQSTCLQCRNQIGIEPRFAEHGGGAQFRSRDRHDRGAENRECDDRRRVVRIAGGRIVTDRRLRDRSIGRRPRCRRWRRGSSELRGRAVARRWRSRARWRRRQARRRFRGERYARAIRPRSGPGTARLAGVANCEIASRRAAPNRGSGPRRAARVAAATRREIRTSTVARRPARAGRCAFRLRTSCRRARRCRPAAPSAAALRLSLTVNRSGPALGDDDQFGRLVCCTLRVERRARSRSTASRKSGCSMSPMSCTAGEPRFVVGERHRNRRSRFANRRFAFLNQSVQCRSVFGRAHCREKILVVDHAAEPREDSQVFVVAGGADQEEDVGEAAAAAERNAARRDAEREDRLGQDCRHRAARMQAAPRRCRAPSNAFLRGRARPRPFSPGPTADAFGRPARSSSRSRCRGCGHRAALRSLRASTNRRSKSSSIVGVGRSIERAFHLHEGFVVGKADAVFQPMVNFGGRESPLAADAAGRQLAALR